MRKVYKYQLDVKGYQEIIVPLAAETKFSDRVLYCAVQNDIPCLWIMVDCEEPKKCVGITIRGTGHDADDTVGLVHIGSFMLLNNQFVAHVFA